MRAIRSTWASEARPKALRSSLILSAWRWWRVGRLMEAAERARQAGQINHAAALLDQAQGLTRELQERRHA